MKTIILLLTSISFLMITNERADSVYQYELNSLDGENISLSDFEGDLLLIVNTASECGFTPQYEGLQELYQTYSGQGFKVLGFPANNFGGQEPGTDKEIAQFCQANYGVSFPMFSKVSVKGDDQHPLFSYLTDAENPDFTGDISWNFEKFLIDRNGNVVRRFKSNVEPMSEELIAAVEGNL
ncbi:glutathione peroxidase [Rhodohalobacter sp. 614A]|uniref:glutathione peroxidase n=1 Tax=Rhodohalobacter sp. 614A TaxID=2908649 RepID=UPI0021031C77|nr:glutathione peroxidase [Rhodohalobacter sp. 614A]